MRITAADKKLTNKQFAEKYAGKVFSRGGDGQRRIITGYVAASADKPLALNDAGVIGSLEDSPSHLNDLKTFATVMPEGDKYYNAGGNYVREDWEYSEEIEPVLPSYATQETY